MTYINGNGAICRETGRYTAIGREKALERCGEGLGQYTAIGRGLWRMAYAEMIWGKWRKGGWRLAEIILANGKKRYGG